MNSKKKRNSSLKDLRQQHAMCQMKGEGDALESVKRSPRIAHASEDLY